MVVFLKLVKNKIVPRNHFGHHASQGFDSQRERCHVQKQQILDVTLEDTALDGCAHGDRLIRVHGFIGSFVEELLNDGLNLLR